MSSQEILTIHSKDSAVLPRLGKTSPILSYFCVYNPSLGPHEDNTKDQILYYTAKKVVPADVKMKQVGLAQALVNFTQTFSPSQPTQNVHSQKNRMIFLQPEPGFWMHMCVELGIQRKQIKDSHGKEKLVTEYLDSQLDDKALEAVLKIGYEQFKLLNGTFGSIIYDEHGEINRQRTRSLMHAIEEFFSEWIWKWDFDRLDIMTFTAVFNGVPTLPIPRNNYLKIHEFDKAMKAKFEDSLCYLFVQSAGEGGLVYRSPDLHINDVCALRKHVLKRVDKHFKSEKRKRDMDQLNKAPSAPKTSGLKQFTKTLSHVHILNYFSSGGSKSTDTNSASSVDSSSAIATNAANTPGSDAASISSSPSSSLMPASEKGIYLTGLVESTAIGMNGEERLVTKSDFVKVYLTSTYDGESVSDKLTEYYLLVYKHKGNSVWNFLLPATPKSQEFLSDPSFYTDLESYMNEKNLEGLVGIITESMANVQEKSLNLGKNYKCFYYDNISLNIKSTMMDTKDKKSMQITNDMLLQLLQVREDFEKTTRTSEVYTRSTANHWIAGTRLYNTLSDDNDFTEMYLVAAKKDTSLADVEETLNKMSTSLLDTIHTE